MFSVTNNRYNRGFHITFANGWTISVQFGSINYISDRGNPEGSIDAEIAIWDKNGEWYEFEDSSSGNVLGWQTADQVAEWIQKTASMAP